MAVAGSRIPIHKLIINHMSKVSQLLPVNDSMNAVIIDNVPDKFRDGFAIGFVDAWDVTWNNKADSFYNFGGNSFGSSYLRISMSPYQPDSELILVSKKKFRMPVRFGYGMSISQRILGQEVEISLVGCSFNDDETVENIVDMAPIAISGSVTIASNIATINTASAHGLRGGDRVVLAGNTENRLNVGPVVVTVVTATQFTVPCTLANASYTAGGYIYAADPIALASNALAMLYENTTATNASFVARRNGGKFRSLNSTVVTTVAIQSNTSPYTDAFNSAGDMNLIQSIEEALYIGRTSDNLSTAPSGSGRYTQGLPDDDHYYKLRIRVKNLKNFSKVNAKITTIAKTGTAVATVTTAAAHGLVTGQYVQIYGVRDQTNFPNLTTAAAVTVVNPTQFTITIGGAVTANSAGGTVSLWEGSVSLPGAINLAIASIQRTNNILTVTMNTTATGLLPGEYCELAGMDGSGAAYDGAYKVLRMNGSTYELESVGVDFGSITCGGSVIKRTDVRMNYVRNLDYTHIVAELTGNHGATDVAKAFPVVPVSLPTLATLTTLTGGGIAHDGADSGNPVKIGGKAMTADPTPVAGADRADLYVDTLGKAVNTPLAPRNLVGQGNITLTNTTETTVIAALGASVFTDISTIIVANTSATGVRVDFRDATAGTVRHSVWIPATTTIECNFDDCPLKQTTAANGPWTAQLSASVTDVRITMVGPGRKA